MAIKEVVLLYNESRQPNFSFIKKEGEKTTSLAQRRRRFNTSLSK
jgi:hypothetical protein